MQRDEAIRELQLNLRAIRDRLNQDLDEMDAAVAAANAGRHGVGSTQESQGPGRWVYERALSRI